MSIHSVILEEDGQKLQVWLQWDKINCTTKKLGARELIGPNGVVPDDVPGLTEDGEDLSCHGPGINIKTGDVNAGGPQKTGRVNTGGANNVGGVNTERAKSGRAKNTGRVKTQTGGSG